MNEEENVSQEPVEESSTNPNIDDIIKNVINNQKEQESAEELYKKMFRQIIDCIDQQGKNIDYLKEQVDRLSHENEDIIYWTNKTINNIKFIYKWLAIGSGAYVILTIANIIINLFK